MRNEDLNLENVTLPGFGYKRSVAHVTAYKYVDKTSQQNKAVSIRTESASHHASQLFEAPAKRSLETTIFSPTLFSLSIVRETGCKNLTVMYRHSALHRRSL